jgi:hypothetical protein
MIWSMVPERWAGAEHGGEPLVDLDVEGVLPQVDVARVADLAG